MRILVLVIMVIAFLIGGGSSSMLMVNLKSRTKNINYEDLATIKAQKEELEKQGLDLEKIEDPTIKDALKTLENAPKKWKVSIAGILGILVGLLSLFMVIIAFMKKEMVKKVSIAVIALSALLWILTPSIKASDFSGADPKSIAVIALVGLVIASICAIASYNMHLKKSTTN